VIGFHQSVSALGGLTTATNSSASPKSGVICPAEALELSFDVGAGPSSPGGGPGIETGPPSLGEAPSASVGGVLLESDRGLEQILHKHAGR
jgi:hypothetical protein